MTVIDVEKISITEPESLLACVKLARDLRIVETAAKKGQGNLFTGMLVQARLIYAEWYEKKDSLNSEEPFYGLAASVFEAESRKALIEAGTMQILEADVPLYTRYTRELANLLRVGAPMLEREDSTGNYILSGRSACNTWGKEFGEWCDAVKKQREIDALKETGFGVVEEPEAQESDSEMKENVSIIKDETLRELVETFVSQVATIEELGGAEVAIQAVNTYVAKLTNRLAAGEFKKVQEAAANDSNANAA